MNPHIWWYIARSSGIVAWLMLTASVLWGIVLATDLFPRWRRAAWLLDLHRWLAGFTIFFVGGHLAALVIDGSVHFGPRELLIPFASTWRPTAVALGVVAVWLLLAVEVTALAMKRLPDTWWRGIHIASYLVFWAVSVHGALAGTDASKALYSVTALVAVAAMVFAAIYRTLTRDLPKRQLRRVRERPSLRATADSDTQR
jgi:sulfoxide reductase heme-binding subunit YedZ